MDNKLQQALELCNRQDFDQAEGLLQQFLKDEPENSEAWRVLAQVHWIHMGKPEQAYDELIEALRCNPKNLWALILMGNLLSKEHKDSEHAMDYFDKVLEYYPDNALAINNIGGVLLQQEEFEKAIPYFERSISLDETSANYHYGLVPDKEFGGYQFLAWYYVSIARVMPEMLSKLGLPYDKAYEKALGLYNSLNGKK